MRLSLFFAVLTLGVSTVFADDVAPGTTLSLEDCRTYALQNNKDLMISRQRMAKAHHNNREAFAAYLPALDFTGAYAYNQKEMSLFDGDKYLPIKRFNASTGGYDFALVTNPATGEPVLNPATGQPIPAEVAYLPKEEVTFDTHNVFFGAVTLTQPIYMGGKIVAMNRLTHFAEELAREQHNSEVQNVIYAVDAAYWQVVSLKAKYDLAVSYVSLVDSLAQNVRKMMAQGLATRADMLSVDVRLNTARVDLTKVENGLTLSRMALAQVCGLPIDGGYRLADEGVSAKDCVLNEKTRDADINTAWSNRSDLRSLSLGIEIADQQKVVARSAMLPQVALVGSYSFSNPNVFNGYSQKFAGQFSVGALVKIPIWHWGGNYHKYKAAEADAEILRLRLEDAREKVNLQLSQASYRSAEASKTYRATQANLASADENLRVASLAFREGMITSDDVLAAQTAWLKANSECIDAMIDVHLCDTYLSKTLGTLGQ